MKCLTSKLEPTNIATDARSWYFWLAEFFFLQHSVKSIVTKHQLLYYYYPDNNQFENSTLIVFELMGPI